MNAERKADRESHRGGAIAPWGLESGAGAVNLVLLALNARDGIALSTRLSSTRW